MHSFFTDAQKRERAGLEKEIQSIEAIFATPGEKILGGLPGWEASLPIPGTWYYPEPTNLRSSSGAEILRTEN